MSRLIGTFRALCSPPNCLTFSRMVLSPFAAASIFCGDSVVSACILGYSLSSDMADGWLSRVTNSSTTAGSYLDPLADKITSLSVPPALYLVGSFPAPLLSLIVAKDLLLSSGSLVSLYRGLSKAPPLKPTLISKVNTLVLSIYILALLLQDFIQYEAFGILVRRLMEPILYVTSTGTLASYAKIAASRLFS